MWRTALAVLAAVLLAGQAMRIVTAQRSPAPGQMVDAGGRALHVDCRGAGKVTVWLEAGLGDFSVQWRAVQAALVRDARVCAYDRAGLGWSDDRRAAPSFDAVVDDAVRVIDALSPAGPVVLVGHSFGGLIARGVVARMPTRVRGVVLVDPAHEQQLDRWPPLRASLSTAATAFDWLDRAGLAGGLALAWPWMPSRGLTGDARRDYVAVLASRRYFRAAAAEMRAFSAMLDVVASRDLTLGDMPLVVISRGRSEPGVDEAVWQDLQRDSTRLSTRASRVVAEGSGHAVPVERAGLVAAVVRRLLVGPPVVAE